MHKSWVGLAAASLMTIAVAGCSGDAALDPAQTGDGENTIELAQFPDRPYWGDTHLHTDNSIDAFGFGVRLGPEDALRFARGEEVTATTGAKPRPMSKGATTAMGTPKPATPCRKELKAQARSRSCIVGSAVSRAMPWPMMRMAPASSTTR